MPDVPEGDCQLSRVKMLRGTVTALQKSTSIVIFAAALVVFAPVARSAEPPAIAAGAPPPGVPDASLTHSAAKATTFKIGTIVTNLAIFSVGTGSLLGGGLLTAFNVSKSWALFTANDYAWDTWFPTEANKDANQGFDVKQSFWRTTGKFLTYKPVDTAIKFASIYLYTGSAGVMLIYGTASSVVNTGVFYVNDVAWDVYDWWMSPARPQRPTMAEAPRPTMLGQR